MIDTQVQRLPDGAIVFDAALFGRAGVAPPDSNWFDAAHWSQRRKAEARSGGRGGVAFVDTPLGACVLRHYHRGGLAAAVSADRYVWTGAARTRSFREFNLLARMVGIGLPVPAPIAARCTRSGLGYRADLVMRRVCGVRTLAERLLAHTLDPVLAGRVGRTLAGFHSAGVWHADLNANNVLAADDAGPRAADAAGHDAADAAGSGAAVGEGVWLIDFDRGRLRAPALAWQESNLARLNRSFVKLGARRESADFNTVFWHPMLAAYHAALAGDASLDRGE